MSTLGLLNNEEKKVLGVKLLNDEKKIANILNSTSDF